MSRGKVKPDAPLFASEHAGQHLTPSGLRQILQRIGQNAGVGHCTPHTFRRTCALWCHRNGWRLTEIQRLLGHSDLTVLRQYLDLNDSDVHIAHQERGPVDHMPLY